MRVLNGTLAALTLALMMVFGEVQTVQAEGVAGDTTRAGTQITFEQAMQIALEKNITLAQAQNAVASSDATVRGAKLSFLPNLQLNTSSAQTYGRNFSETTGDVLNHNNQSVNAGVSSSVTLFNGMQNVANLHEAEKNQSATTLDLARAKQTTVFTVASICFSVSSFDFLRVPGSHSKVISSALLHGATAVRRLTRPSSCWVDRNDGVPPPK